MNYSLFNQVPSAASAPALWQPEQDHLVSVAPSGLSYLPGYITSKLETRLLTLLDEATWLDDLKRRVQHYGYRYDYKSRRIDYSMYLGPLPHWCEYYAQQLAAEGIFSSPPDQVIVNEYMPGQGIAPHIDCTPCFEDTIVSLSLGSACVMNFTQLADPTQRYDQLLERGSAVVLQNAARFEWQHGIKPLKSDTVNGQRLLRQRRVSLTFRKVKL
jgi:alkylated DNA repair dioxygenase AlkB